MNQSPGGNRWCFTRASVEHVEDMRTITDRAKGGKLDRRFSIHTHTHTHTHIHTWIILIQSSALNWFVVDAQHPARLLRRTDDTIEFNFFRQMEPLSDGDQQMWLENVECLDLLFDDSARTDRHPRANKKANYYFDPALVHRFRGLLFPHWDSLSIGDYWQRCKPNCFFFHSPLMTSIWIIKFKSRYL